MRVPGKCLPDNNPPEVVGSIYTIIPGYKNSGRGVRVIGTSGGRKEYDVEDLLTEEVFRIKKNLIQGPAAKKRPDFHRHPGLHDILQVGVWDYDQRRYSVLRNNPSLCGDLLRMDPETGEPVHWKNEVSTFYVFRSLLQKIPDIEMGQTLCMVSDQNLTEGDLTQLKTFLEIDPENNPSRFLSLGIFPTAEIEALSPIHLDLSFGENPRVILSTDIEDGKVRRYEILNTRVLDGVRILEMEKIFDHYFR